VWLALEAVALTGMELASRGRMPVRDCDVFVGILSHRCGSIAPEAGKSFSERRYFGRTFAGGPAPAPQTSSLVRPGEQMTFTLSGGGYLITSTPGFQGYLIAECRFKAAGLGFLSDRGIQKFGSCYIAQTM